MASAEQDDGLEQLLTVADVAGNMGCHEQTVRGWIRTGELKGSRLGTRIGYRIPRSEYMAFLRRRTLMGQVAGQLLAAAAAEPTL